MQLVMKMFRFFEFFKRRKAFSSQNPAVTIARWGGINDGESERATWACEEGKSRLTMVALY